MVAERVWEIEQMDGTVESWTARDLSKMSGVEIKVIRARLSRGMGMPGLVSPARSWGLREGLIRVSEAQRAREARELKRIARQVELSAAREAQLAVVYELLAPEGHTERHTLRALLAMTRQYLPAPVLRARLEAGERRVTGLLCAENERAEDIPERGPI